MRRGYSPRGMKEEAHGAIAPGRWVSFSSVAVIIPCHNEEATIGSVVADFRRFLPGARVVVVDNASADRTSSTAAAAGARVIFEPRLGKGFAVLSGLRSEPAADLFVIVDGDGTYPADKAPDLIAAASSGADMVIGARLADPAADAFRPGHSFGNRLFIGLVRLLFGIRTRDLFSGYRVLTRRFLETAPLIAKGFDVEAELSLQAKVQELPVAEVVVPFRPRLEGTRSKLRTFRDGYHILIAILTFFRDYRPIAFFGTLSLVLLSGAAAGAVRAVQLGSASSAIACIVSATLLVLSVVSLSCGVVLSSINRRSAELSARMLRR